MKRLNHFGYGSSSTTSHSWSLSRVAQSRIIGKPQEHYWATRLSRVPQRTGFNYLAILIVFDRWGHGSWAELSAGRIASLTSTMPCWTRLYSQDDSLTWHLSSIPLYDLSYEWRQYRTRGHLFVNGGTPLCRLKKQILGSTAVATYLLSDVNPRDLVKSQRYEVTHVIPLFLQFCLWSSP